VHLPQAAPPACILQPVKKKFNLEIELRISACGDVHFPLITPGNASLTLGT
jgi:hypothetical protein